MDLSKKRDFILNGNMNKVIISLALPLMLNNLIQTVYNLTDTYWVSRIGDVEVAATTLVWPVLFFFMSIGIGLSIGGAAMIAQYIGSGRREEAREVGGQIIGFSAYLSILFGVIGFILSPTVVRLMGGEGVLLEKATAFLQVTFFEIPLMFMFFGFNSIKQGQGDTVTPMILSTGSVLLNMVLDPLFIFNFGMGITGAAWATVVSRAVFTVYALYTLFHHDAGIRLRRSDLRLRKDVLWRILKIGVPSSFGQSMEAFGFGLLNIFIISYGANTMAAFGIGNRINSLVMMPAMGIGNALATVIGQNIGADQLQRAKTAVKHSAVLSTSFMVMGGVVMYFLSPSIIGAFSKNPDVVRQGSYYLNLISLSLPLMGMFQIFNGVFQGSGHTVSAMIMMLGRLWCIRLPMIILFKYFTDWGSDGIWYAMNLSNLFICLVGWAMFSTGRWQKKVIHRHGDVQEADMELAEPDVAG